MAQEVKPFHQVRLALAVIADDQINSGGKWEKYFLVIPKPESRKFLDYHSILNGITTDRKPESFGISIKQGFNEPFSFIFTCGVC